MVGQASFFLRRTPHNQSEIPAAWSRLVGRTPTLESSLYRYTVLSESAEVEIMLMRGPVVQERATLLFQPDPVSRLQFLATFKNISLEPERLLMLAVLEDAIKCVEKYATFNSGGNRKLFDEAIDWIRTENDEWLFSFDNVCDAVGLNAGLLRRALLHMVADRCRVRRPEQSYPSRTSIESSNKIVSESASSRSPRFSPKNAA
jgi:hypothetical protein